MKTNYSNNSDFDLFDNYFSYSMRQLILLSLLLLLTVSSFAQTPDIERARTLFTGEKYYEALEILDAERTRLGKWTPELSMLRIETLDKVANYFHWEQNANRELAEEVKRYGSYLEQGGNLGADKAAWIRSIGETLAGVERDYQVRRSDAFQKVLAAFENKEYDKTLELLTEGAEQGKTAFMVELGYFYSSQQYWDLGTEWFEKATERGNLGGLNGLISIHWEFNRKDQVKEYSEALAKRGDARGMKSLGEYYYTVWPPNYPESAKWFEKSAHKGDVYSMNKLASLYLEGKHNFEADSVKAAEWYHKAALWGSVEGMYDLGRLLIESDDPSLKDKATGFEWMEKAAEEGYAKALDFLGSGYYWGMESLQRDFVKAAAYYKRLGGDEGYYKLAEIYKKGGYGIEKDAALSQEYLDLVSEEYLERKKELLEEDWSWF